MIFIASTDAGKNQCAFVTDWVAIGGGKTRTFSRSDSLSRGSSHSSCLEFMYRVIENGHSVFKQSVQSFFSIKNVFFLSLKTCYMIRGSAMGGKERGNRPRTACSRGRCTRGLSGNLTPLLVGPVCL